MNKTPKLALALSALMLLTFAAHAGAYTVMPWSKPTPPRRLMPPTFTAAGVYGGIVGDMLTIDGVSYRLRPNTDAYLIGVGAVAMPMVPIGSHVFACGVGAADTGVIWNFVVRPADEDRRGNVDMSSFVHVRSADTPQ